MKTPDLRPFVVQDPNWTPGYVPPPVEQAPCARMTLDGLKRLLDAAASSGDSAFVGLCFELENRG